MLQYAQITLKTEVDLDTNKAQQEIDRNASIKILELEIQDLKSKYKNARLVSERTAAALFYKTALKIAKARHKWETYPLLSDEPFFKEFRIGFYKKRSTIFQVENGQWCGSFDPRNKYRGDSLETILKNMLDLKW
jgi:hypothetical protein